MSAKLAQPLGVLERYRQISRANSASLVRPSSPGMISPPQILEMIRKATVRYCNKSVDLSPFKADENTGAKMAAEGQPKPTTASTGEKAPAAQRKIPGNLPYLTASGTLKTAMERMIEPPRPPKFNADFLENVLKLKGGSARGVPPILKRMGFLTSDGATTDLYDKFRTNSGR